MGEPPSTKPPRNNAESRELLRTSGAARQIERRLFLKQGLSIGAMTLLTGCDVTDTSAVQSVIGKWTGVPLRTFLQRIGADLTAKYVGFECADGYYSSIDMASALHPQTFLTFKISDEILAPRYGYPLKLRIPTKLGFKNPKWITAIFVTNRFPGGFWEDRGYNWFAGV